MKLEAPERPLGYVAINVYFSRQMFLMGALGIGPISRYTTVLRYHNIQGMKTTNTMTYNSYNELKLHIYDTAFLFNTTFPLNVEPHYYKLNHILGVGVSFNEIGEKTG